MENYFPEQDRVLIIDNKNKYPNKQFYEFIPFHPVCVTSEMVGTSVEELLRHNFPSKRSWECSRLCDFPQELIIRLNYRSHMKYILFRSKVNRPIEIVDIYTSDGVYGNFNDVEYRKIDQIKNLTDEGITVKIDSIGNYLKLIFPKQSKKTRDNPYGQIGLSQLKIFGKKINHLLYYNQIDDDTKNSIDRILIEMGIPINDIYSQIHNVDYEIASVDEDTKETLKDLLIIMRRAEKTNDFELLKRMKKDMKIVYLIGNELLNSKRQLDFSVAKEDFDTAVKLRRKIEDLISRRDHFDAIYETSRYEKMIVMKRPTTADLLAEEEYNLKIERERLEKERKDKEERERLRKLKELENDQNRQTKVKEEKYIKFIDKNEKFVEYSSYDKKKENEKDFLDELKYNQGDRDLEPYFSPLARSAGGNIPIIDINKLRRALRQGILNVTGVRLYSSMLGDDWKMREAAIKAFIEFVENPLIPRYINKTLYLFQSCIEIAKYSCDDKVVQIYLEGLKLLSTCLAPPICGNDIDPHLIQKSVQWFIPKYIKKISELNYRARDLTMNTLISIFKHPALNTGDLVKSCMDIVERQDGITPDKQPATCLLARLEIILHVLEEYGVDESLWDWYPMFTELIIPSLFHPNPDCRMVGIEITLFLYKFIGDDIKIIINDINNLKPNLRDMINQRIIEIDKQTQKELRISNDNKGTNKSKEINKLYTIKENENDK